MSLTREHVQLQSDWLDVQERFVAAKAAAAADPSNEDLAAECAEAGAEMRTMRQYWREIREAVTVEIEDGDAVAVAETVTAGIGMTNPDAEES